MATDPDTLTPCDQALAVHALQLSGDELDAGEVQRAEEHIAHCPSCRELSVQNAQVQTLARSAYISVHVSSGFAARTMAALPQTATVSAPQTQPRVFAAAQAHSFSWRRSAIAASVAILVAGGIIAVTMSSSRRVVAVSSKPGALVDGAGREVNDIRAGQLCEARQNTVVRVPNQGTLSVLKDARFQFRNANEKGVAEMELRSGDVYAQANGADGVRVACANFQTEVPEGDCFVTQETDSVPRGVVIVFTGRANVTPNQQAMLPLKSGQVFFSVGEGAEAFMDTLSIAEVPNLEAASRKEAPADASTLRKQYADRVEGYKQELATLKKLHAETKPDDPKKQELSVRVERVSSYLHTHELRLKSLAQAELPGRGIPFGEIDRGISGHSDPQTWR